MSLMTPYRLLPALALSLSIGCASSPPPVPTKPDIARLHERHLNRLSQVHRTVLAPKTRFAGQEHFVLAEVVKQVCPECPEQLPLAPGLDAILGELAALGGDFIRDVWELSDLTLSKSGRDEVQYDLLSIRESVVSLRRKLASTDEDKKKLDAELAQLRTQQAAIPEEARRAAGARAHQLDSRNFTHFLNTDEGDVQRTALQKLAKGDTLVSDYHNHHRTALLKAFFAGGQPDGPAKTEGLASALVAEGMGLHFLTDAFSAGHVRTPRRTALHYWNEREATFFAKFKSYMVDQIVSAIDRDNWWSFIAPDCSLQDAARAAIEEMLQVNGIPDYTLGDLVGMAFHDYDGSKGVNVSVLDPTGATQTGPLVGDGDLVGNPNKDAVFTLQHAEAAVKASLEEVKAQFDAGRMAGAKFDDPARNDGLYAAEKLLPVPSPDSQQPAATPVWKAANWLALLANKEMVEALTLTVASKKSTFEEIADSMPDGYKKDALKKGVVQPLADDPIGVLRSVLGRK